MLDECVLGVQLSDTKTSLNLDGWVSGVCHHRENNSGIKVERPECECGPSL